MISRKAIGDVVVVAVAVVVVGGGGGGVISDIDVGGR